MTLSLVSADVRRHNLALVATRLGRAPISRSELAAETGLTRGAVTSLVDELEAVGIVRTVAPVAHDGRGRPRTLLELAADDVAIVTALLDADQAATIVTAVGGERLLRRERRHARPLGRPEPVVDVLAAVLAEALEEVASLGRRIAELTVVVWAPVGGEPPIVLADTDLGWGPVDLLGMLRERLPGLIELERSIPGGIRLCSDTAVAALAEHAAAGSASELLYLKGDSGIGGAIIIRGELATGSHGIGGALGHLPIVPNGEPCSCGQRGCLVTVAGPDALLERSALSELAVHSGLRAALDEFTRRVRAGDPATLAAWQPAAAEIARTLQVLALSVDPEVIVLGGFLAGLAEDVEAAFVAIQPNADPRYLAPARVVGSRLGVDAALLGAEHASQQRLLADPLSLAAH